MNNDLEKLYCSIKELDRDHEWERFFIESCGLNYEKYFWNEDILTKDLLEENLENLLENINKFHRYINESASWVTSIDDIYIGFQILGLLIIRTGAAMPFVVYDNILYSIR